MKIFSIIIGFLAVLAFATPSFAQTSLQTLTISELKSELSEAQVFHALKQAKTSADGPRGVTSIMTICSGSGRCCLISTKHMLAESMRSLSKRERGRKNSLEADAYQTPYLFRKIDGVPYIANRAPFTPKRRKYLNKLLKDNNKICEFDSLTIDLGAPQNKVRNKDGLKSLLGGIGAVLEQIQ